MTLRAIYAEVATPARARFVLTIGHSNHPFAHFLDLLRRHNIEAVADVRSRPYSRFVPHFSKERLARLLRDEGIGYLYLGAELGGRPPSGEAPASSGSTLFPGRRAVGSPVRGPGRRPVTYRSRIEQPEFRQGIDRLLEAVRARRVALMCRERDPLDCHRLHLICRRLAPTGLSILHILPGGEVETQAATERRLLERGQSGELPLFQDAGQTPERAALEGAYDAWWERSR
jgi:uncharacterized protein (DUF488 family)